MNRVHHKFSLKNTNCNQKITKIMEIVRVEDADLQDIEGNRCRSFRAVSEPLTAQTILNDIQHHQRQRVIIICVTAHRNCVALSPMVAFEQTGSNRGKGLSQSRENRV